MTIDCARRNVIPTSLGVLYALPSNQHGVGSLPYSVGIIGPDPLNKPTLISLPRTNFAVHQSSTCRHTGSSTVISSCNYMATGLMAAATVRLPQIRSDAGDCDRPAQSSELSPHIFLWLPPDWAQCLGVVASVGNLLSCYSSPPRILVLSRTKPTWLYRTWLTFVSSAQILRELSWLDDRVTPAGLRHHLGRGRPVGNYHIHPLTPERSGLTQAELSCLRSVFAGESVRDLATRSGLSVKTVYTQKDSGLRKLGLK